MKNIIKLIVKESGIDQRVDIFINKQESSLSRTRIKNLILKEKLKINDLIITNPSKKLNIRDKIQLEIPDPEKASLKPYNYKLNIIYEDHDLLVIDKSAGISIHPGAGNYDNTIVNALISYCGESLSNIGDELRPGIVHRIDKDTSGLIVVAKNNISHEHLSNQFNKHTIKRIYLALIWGKLRPQTGTIETLITRSSNNRQLMEVGINKGKKAITNYKTLEVFENNNSPTLSLIECKLKTGRTHQIRVHMSYKGNNILGDKKYKKKFKKIKNINSDLEKVILSLDRQFLHAKALSFIHPKTGKELEFTSILPQELEKILKILRKLRK
jgi:23S rRNA pseudouridine1911/1915/1917 synthase